MKLRRVGLWVAVILVGLFVANVVISALFTALSILWSLVYTGLVIAVLGGLLYGVFKLYRLTTGDRTSTRSDPSQYGLDTTTRSTTRDSQDRIDTLRDRYASGELSEAELERELERELETEGLERELDRERA